MIGQAAEMINASQRPLILAGHGVLMSHAIEEVARFAERAHVPVAMTLLGLGALPSQHPLNLGMMGMHGEAWVNAAIQEADLLVALGMRFDDRVTGRLATFATQARKIHIEIDPSEVNKNVKVDLGLVGDLKDILRQILTLTKPAAHSGWLARIGGMRSESAVRDIQNLPDSGHLYAAHVIHDLWRHTRGDATIVTDVGQHQMWAAQYYRIDRPHSWITSGGLGTMGFGLPAAIGAKFAQPGRNVWVICGDGGFQMTQAELSTAAQEGIKVNVAIINNGYLGMVRQWQEFFYERRYAATPLRNPDFVKIAEAHGLPGMRVTRRSEVEDAIRSAEESQGTVVIDFRVEQEDSVFPMVPSGADLHAMIRRPSPIVETAMDE
jgi:acetolactate synthase-1/2/3 large subunit